MRSKAESLDQFVTHRVQYPNIPRNDCTLATDTQVGEQVVGEDFPHANRLTGLHHDPRNQAALGACLHAQRRVRV